MLLNISNSLILLMRENESPFCNNSICFSFNLTLERLITFISCKLLLVPCSPLLFSPKCSFFLSSVFLKVSVFSLFCHPLCCHGHQSCLFLFSRLYLPCSPQPPLKKNNVPTSRQVPCHILTGVKPHIGRL